MQGSSAPMVLDNMAADAPAAPLHFAEIYQRHFSFVWRSAQSLGATRAVLDDVVQDVFLVVHRQLPKFEGRSSVRTWLSGIVLNVVRHHRRSLARRNLHEQPSEGLPDPNDFPSSVQDPFVSAEIVEQARLLQCMLETLDDEKREVFVLADLEEFTVPEIAEALGIKLNTAYSRLRLAREQLEKTLARHRVQGQCR